MERWFPENISTYGADIDWLFSLIYYIVGAWFVVTEAVIVYFIFRYRRRHATPAAYIRGDRWAELAWVLVPAAVVLALDLGIDVAAGPVWARVKETAPEAAVEVRVTGKQFNWDITYPGPDGKFDTDDDRTLENELHVPVNQNVVVYLQATDVIHSFFLPHARLKQDILPGRTIRAWFNLTKTGRYELACAELCGFGHYNMRGFLTVHAPDEYRRWVGEQWAPKAEEQAAS